jgi:hypothetical protein
MPLWVTQIPYVNINIWAYELVTFGEIKAK